MRLNTKKEIIGLINTVEEAAEYLGMDNVNEKIKLQILGDCESALAAIIAMFQSSVLFEMALKKRVRDIHSKMISMRLIKNRRNIISQTAKDLRVLKDMIEKEIAGTLEIVFLPYKYSMWDCMDSIWEAAKEDPSCICHIIPIPYYDKKMDGSLGRRHYERQAFPMETESYEAYDMDAMRPDIIYIHNPYDGNNRVTCVEPIFYSKQLKKYTDMLVYVPYYLINFTEDYKSLAVKCRPSGCLNADHIILQSQNLKLCYMENGIPADKLKALGSPKIDMIINKIHDYQIPARWEHILDGYQVILLNSSLTTFLSKEKWLEKIEEVIIACLSRTDIALIFRPHPLLEATINSMRPYSQKQYQRILEILKNSNRAIFDMGEDSLPAIKASHALISDHSSILSQYVFTGKPALSLTDSSKDREKKVFCDYFSGYFLEDGTTVEDFLDMVIRGEDEKRAERLTYALQSVANSDGASGKKIHDYIKKELQKPFCTIN